MVIRRLVGGLGLLAWLGLWYWCALKLRRVLPRPGRRWLGAIDRHGARLLASHCRRHGALMIKVGQFVATRPDVFPLAYVDACAPLRDQAPARSFPVIRAALAEAYEDRIEAHFSRIEEQPLAAASFGQVHRAWLNDGTLVAVKVQYPDLGPLVAADLWVLRRAIGAFQVLLPGWPLHLVYAAIERTSREEQDYLHEGSVADRLRAGLAEKGLAVPKVLWPHTREKVLAMEFAHGTTLAGIDLERLGMDKRRQLADRLIGGFLHSLLVDGLFHADPHAGNLIYDETRDRLWLIDFGMSASIDARDRELYRRFLERLRQDDTDGMVEVLVELGWVLPGADRSKLKGLVREIYGSLAQLDPATFKGSRRQAELATKMGEFLRRVDGLVFPDHTVLLSRATGLIEGVCTTLVPGEGLLNLVKPHLKGLASVRLQLRLWRDELLATWRAYRDLPQRLDSLLNRPQSGFPITTVLAALLLLAAMQIPHETWRAIAVAAAGLALLVGLRR